MITAEHLKELSADPRKGKVRLLVQKELEGLLSYLIERDFTKRVYANAGGSLQKRRGHLSLSLTRLLRTLDWSSKFGGRNSIDLWRGAVPLPPRTLGKSYLERASDSLKEFQGEIDLVTQELIQLGFQVTEIQTPATKRYYEGEKMTDMITWFISWGDSEE